MSATKTYNGWTNYETWGVALVLDNEQSTQEIALEMAREAIANASTDESVRDGIWTAEQAARYRLAADLKHFTEMLCGTEDNDWGIVEPSLMARQLLGAALSEVNFDEIAEHYLTDN